MKISLKWLADYVKLPADVDELAKKLTMAGLEIEGVQRPGDALRGVIVAQVAESKQHPNADKLSVTRIDTGAGERLQVVCGAKNFKVGDKVPLATVGTTLPNGVTIQKAALRGVDSSGMLCSARELGLSQEHEGLLILDPNAKLGQPIADALGLNDVVFDVSEKPGRDDGLGARDVVFEVNVTPNRADALSHLGIAREVAVLFGTPLKLPPPKLNEGGGAASDKIKIRIEDPEKCSRYLGRVIEGVKIGPSPQWLVDRLTSAGVRAINNVVDVTNYVMLEFGQPLHAFDLDKLAGPEIVVRRAKPNEKLTTLDGKERTLDADDLLICDRDAPQALAGVMGGGHSEVSEKTTRLLLEIAHFQPATVRRSSKRHGLHTEASHRFERGTDVQNAAAVADRAAALIAELSGGTVLRGRVDVYPRPPTERTVALAWAQVGALLGVDVAREETARILGTLGFVAKREDAKGAEWIVPTSRQDVERAEDLIEEVARIRGYDAIPVALPRGLSELVPEAPEQEAERRVRHALAGVGFGEVVNYSFVSPKELELLGPGRTRIALMNPLSVEQSVMRDTLYAGLLQNLSRNVRQQQLTVRLYEIGRTYVPDPEGGQKDRPPAVETAHVSGVLHGLREGRAWFSKDAKVDFYDAKGAVEAILAVLRIEGATFSPIEDGRYHPRAAAAVAWRRPGEKQDVVLGSLGELHPRLAKKLDLPADTYLFELDLGALYLAANLVPAFRQLTRFPAVRRDLAIVVPADLGGEQVRSVIHEVGAPLVEDAAVFDSYTGKPLPEGKKNLAFALSYRSPDRTLTDEEVTQAHTRIVEELNRRFGGALRGA